MTESMWRIRSTSECRYTTIWGCQGQPPRARSEKVIVDLRVHAPGRYDDTRPADYRRRIGRARFVAHWELPDQGRTFRFLPVLPCAALRRWRKHAAVEPATLDKRVYDLYEYDRGGKSNAAPPGRIEQLVLELPRRNRGSGSDGSLQGNTDDRADETE